MPFDESSPALPDRIDDLELDDEKSSTYRATRWTPHEVSIVSVPADASVGVGRKLEDDKMSDDTKQTPASEMNEERTLDETMLVIADPSGAIR